MLVIKSTESKRYTLVYKVVVTGLNLPHTLSNPQ